MHSAWKRVKAKKGSAGIDKMTIADFPALAQENWDKIRESLLNGTYEAKPVRRVEIPKGNTGKTRPLRELKSSGQIKPSRSLSGG